MTDEPSYLPSGMPQPAYFEGALDAPYWEATRRHELVIQRCEACGTPQWEPEWICRSCQSSRLTWTAVSGRGRIYSSARVWHPTHPSLKGAVPYITVLVELSDAPGVRMIGNLVGDREQEAEIGTEVEAVFEDHVGVEHPYTLVHWRMRDAARAGALPHTP